MAAPGHWHFQVCGRGSRPPRAYRLGLATYPSDTGVRTATFQLVAGVALYGGFSGTEAELEERDIATHATILSGNLGSGKSCNVATGATGATIDGFTITGGNAGLAVDCTT
jgi:hypothetical protein